MEGTLLFSEKASFLAYQAACEKIGLALGVKFEDFLPLYGKDYKQILKALLPDLSEEDVQKIREFYKERQSEYYSEVRINLPVKELLESLRGTHHTALVTNASKATTHGMLGYFSLTSLFDLIITREDVTNPKPDPEGYLKAMGAFKVDPSSSLILEDSKGGYLAARATGSQVLFVGNVSF